MASPFLDDRVIEACLAVRPSERVTPWQYKPLLTTAMSGIVPDACLRRTNKAAASMDAANGLREHRADLLALWEGSRLEQLGLVDGAALRRLAQRPATPGLRDAILYSTIAAPKCGCAASTGRAGARRPRPHDHSSQRKGTRMALKFGADVSTAETDYGTVLLDERAGEYWELNPTATLVVSTLMAGGDEADAVAALTEAFDITPERARQDVDALVQQLRTSGLAR